MGVPGFAPWLTNRYQNVASKTLPELTSGLYVDVNGVIHPFCHGEGVDSLPEEEKIENILSYLQNLVVLVSPRDVLYLAVDGVAPSAKMNQQRARRYMNNAYEVMKKGNAMPEEKPKADSFDSNAISPGTEFMDRLTRALNMFIQKQLSEEHSLWRNLCIIISDSNVPCEGEHKIIRFLRAQSSSPQFFTNSHVIVGLDADLIFLSLSLHVPHLFIMRQLNDFKKKEEKSSVSISLSISNAPTSFSFEYFDVDKIGNAIVSEIYVRCQLKNFHYHNVDDFSSESASGFVFAPLKKEPTNTSKLSNLFHPCTCPFNSKVVDDFIVLGMLIGNDFMPKLPSAYPTQYALDHLLECYIDDVLPYGFLAMPNGRISMTQFSRLLDSYDKCYEKKLFLYSQPKTKECKSIEQNNECFRSLKNIYYESIGVSLDTGLDRCCQTYLDTAQFVWKYYSTLLPINWVWCYPYHHAPFASDLVAYLKKKKVFMPDPSFSILSEPCEKFVQLLSILPPSSASLLPLPCHPLLKQSSSNPHVISKWQVDFTGSFFKPHLAHVLLPAVTLNKVKERFASIKDELSPSELLLNENKRYHLLYYCEEKLSSDASSAKEKENSVEKTADKSPDFNVPALRQHFRFIGERLAGETLYSGKVYCDQYLEHSELSSPPKPRQYSFSEKGVLRKIPISNNCVRGLYPIPRCELVPFVVICFALFLLAHQVLCGFSFFQFQQLIAVFFTVLLLLFFSHFGSQISPVFLTVFGSGFEGRFFCDWICYECHQSNFTGRSTCFFCGYPFIASRSKFFLQNKSQDTLAQLFEANRKKYFRTYCGRE